MWKTLKSQGRSCSDRLLRRRQQSGIRLPRRRQGPRHHRKPYVDDFVGESTLENELMTKFCEIRMRSRLLRRQGLCPAAGQCELGEQGGRHVGCRVYQADGATTSSALPARAEYEVGGGGWRGKGSVLPRHHRKPEVDDLVGDLTLENELMNKFCEIRIRIRLLRRQGQCPAVPRHHQPLSSVEEII